MNLLGFQSQVVTEAYRTMVRATWPSTLKVIVPGGLDATLLREWRQHRPDGLLILRHYYPDENLDALKLTRLTARATTAPGSGVPAKVARARLAPRAAAAYRRRSITAADEIRDLAPIIEVPINEAHQTDPADIQQLSDYSVAFVNDAADAGFKAAVGVFSEGNPADFAWWSRFFPALRAAREHGGYLALHEYGLPGLGLEDWHLLRHRRVWPLLPEDCKVPILITEAGIDGGIEGRREQGWRSYMTAPQYAAWLRAYHGELLKDTYVHGDELFLCGGNDQWRQFDITDEVDLRPVFTEDRPGAPRWHPTPAPPPVPPVNPIPPQDNNMTDVTLSVPTPGLHAVDGNWGKGEAIRPRVGVVIHSSAGGVDHSLEAEYISTRNWFTDPNAGVSAQRIIGAGKFREVTTSVHDGEKAYHAREPSNTDRYGIEFAHPDTATWNATPYPDEQYAMAAELIAAWKLRDEREGDNWPIRLLTRAELAANPSAPGICYHRDLPAGIKDGRTDPTGPFDGARLIRETLAAYAKLKGSPAPAPAPAPDPNHWPNGRIKAPASEYDRLVWTPLQAAADALMNGGNGALGDDEDALAILALKAKNEKRHGINR